LNELNYSLLSWAILCKILEMVDVKTPNNRRASAIDISISVLIIGPLSLNGLVNGAWLET
jgi:hypothetical protein